jgi:Uncharacterised protein family UPF0102
MLPGRVTQSIVHALDRISGRTSSRESTPAHLRTGRRGEEDAYFYLRRRGYVMVARNYRTARHHGEIDLIGWDKDVLCFVEVKTRTTRDVSPPRQLLVARNGTISASLFAITCARFPRGSSQRLRRGASMFSRSITKVRSILPSNYSRMPRSRRKMSSPGWQRVEDRIFCPNSEKTPLSAAG